VLSERLDDGDANARRGYIASVISRIEVGDGIVRVAGQTNTLAELVQRGDEKVSGFVRRWRTREDSNLWPLPSECKATVIFGTTPEPAQARLS